MQLDLRLLLPVVALTAAAARASALNGDWRAAAAAFDAAPLAQPEAVATAAPTATTAIHIATATITIATIAIAVAIATAAVAATSDVWNVP